METLLFIPVILIAFVILFICNPLKSGSAYTSKDYIND